MSSILNRTLAAAPGAYSDAATVRRNAGLSSTTDLGDTDLNQLILDATLRLIADATIRVDGAIASPDSTRRVFTLPHGLIADTDCDADVDSSDLRVRFLKVNADGSVTESATGAVTVSASDYGVFSTANALPAEYDCVVDYRRYHRVLELQDAKRAVADLAAHFAFCRVKAPGRVTRADVQLGEARVEAYMHVKSKWLDSYRSRVAAIVGSTLQ